MEGQSLPIRLAGPVEFQPRLTGGFLLRGVKPEGLSLPAGGLVEVADLGQGGPECAQAVGMLPVRRLAGPSGERDRAGAVPESRLGAGGEHPGQVVADRRAIRRGAVGRVQVVGRRLPVLPLSMQGRAEQEGRQVIRVPPQVLR